MFKKITGTILAIIVGLCPISTVSAAGWHHNPPPRHHYNHHRYNHYRHYRHRDEHKIENIIIGAAIGAVIAGSINHHKNAERDKHRHPNCD